MRRAVLVVVAGCAARTPPPAPPIAATAPPPPAQPAPAPEPAPAEDTSGYSALVDSDAAGDGGGGLHAAPPTVAIGDPKATGDLDKAIIRRYVKRNIIKIQTCYETELASSPKLAGTVTVQFVIDRDGSVASATASGLGNANVETCVAGVIKAIAFPKPKGGGTIQVNYPFTFRPS